MTQDHIFQAVVNNILEILPDLSSAEIQIDNRLKDLGANSIDRMEIVTMTMEDLNLKIPLVEFAPLKNLRDLVTFFHQQKLALV